MAFSIAIIFIFAILAPGIQRFAGHRTGWILAVVPTLLFGYFLLQFSVINADEVLMERYRWLPSLGISLAYSLDGLSLTFALLITGFGALITFYSSSYLKDDPLQGRFFLFLLMFMGAMLGVVLADDIITLFVFWELTSLSSFHLIGFKHRKLNSRKSALQALYVTMGGGLFLLAGLLLLSFAAGGTFTIHEIIAQREVIVSHEFYLAAFILIVVGCFTKSAQVPFHFWLPNAMAGPSPVSAYLHSATMVKAGVYLLARFSAGLGGTEVWTITLTVVGTATMLLGAVMALRSSDLKSVLAYSTITALGTLVLFIGLGYESAIQAAVVFLLVHALYKGTLFLTAGNVDHQAGTRDVLQLRGLRKSMPWTFAATALAALSMAGLPPLFGFMGKELMYGAALSGPTHIWLVTGAAVFANALTVVAAGIVAVRPFFGEPNTVAMEAREAPVPMLVGPLVLSGIGLLYGIGTWFGGVIAFGQDALVGPAMNAILGGSGPHDPLGAWHGFNLELGLSVITLLLGFVAYRNWDSIRNGLARLEGLFEYGPERTYERSMDGLLRFSTWQTNRIQTGNLSSYMTTILVVVIVLMGGSYILKIGGITIPQISLVWYSLLPMFFVLVGVVLVAVTNSRMLAIVALSVAGFSTALLFLTLGAPDLAMTQFLVETLIVIVVLLVMQRLPRMTQELKGSWRKRRDLLLAGMFSAAVMAIMFAVLTQVPDNTLPEFYSTGSVPLAYGHNIVNVILVDFRALDTFGEITVLAIAALGALALLRSRQMRRTNSSSDS